MTDQAHISSAAIADQKSKEAYFTASQSQLIWSRFKKQRSAMIAAAVLVFLMVSGIFAPFLSPYNPTIAGKNDEYTNGAPQIPRFCDDAGCSLRPFVYGVERERSMATNFRWVTKINTEDRKYIHFFVEGWDYKLFGFIPSNTHLFGAPDGFVHLFGTDASGKDIFSRTLHAIWTSMQVGTIGVLIAFVLALIIGGISGYYGGWIDSVLQMITDAVRTVPAIPLFMAVAAFMPPELSGRIEVLLHIDDPGADWLADTGAACAHPPSDRAQSGIRAGRPALRRLVQSCDPTAPAAKFHQLHHRGSGDLLSLHGADRNRPQLHRTGPQGSGELAGGHVAKCDQCRCAAELPMVFHPCHLLHRSRDGLRLRGRRAARRGGPLLGYAQMSDLITVENLTLKFRTDEGLITAVEDVSFRVRKGEVMGLVGESGSGKSVTAKALMHLNARNAVYSPESRIILHTDAGEVDVLALRKARDMKIVRGGAISMIFQEPMASFAPAISIGKQMIEQLMLHSDMTKAQARTLSIEMLDRVGISDASSRIDQYAFELSGGMRQRAMIAMALSTKPRLLIADEPTTALDVTIQAQVIDLMKDLVREFQMGIVFITHDLGVVAQTADHVSVMYLGRLIEKGPVRAVIRDPRHPYTQGLIAALPKLDDLESTLTPVPGDIPSPLERPTGCVFNTRCSKIVGEPCFREVPPDVRIDPVHRVACHIYKDTTTP